MGASLSQEEIGIIFNRFKRINNKLNKLRFVRIQKLKKNVGNEKFQIRRRR